jgi:hypothetical protein
MIDKLPGIARQANGLDEDGDSRRGRARRAQAHGIAGSKHSGPVGR